VTKTFYLSYTDADGVPPYFLLLDDEATFNLITSSANIMGKRSTQLHNHSTLPDDPTVDIVCITAADDRIEPDRAMAISQAAINYLMEQGAITMRLDGQEARN